MRDVLAFAVDCCWWWWSCCASVVADVLRIRATGEGKKLIYSNSRSTAPGGHYFIDISIIIDVDNKNNNFLQL